jgi:CheY-like chemotaxis protein
VLERDGAIKKTNLAAKTGLNYLTCIKYLELLKSLGYAELVRDNKVLDPSERVSINEHGKQFNAKLIKYLENSTDPVTAKSDNIRRATGTTNSVRNAVPAIKVSGKIMLVDDEEDILYTYKAFLDGLGYKIEAFSNPLDALQQFAIDPLGYDLMVTDIRMSSINGLQLYHAIRGLNPNMKIMFVSALDATQELLSVLPSLDRDLVLKKPVTRRVLTDAVDRIMHANYPVDMPDPIVRSSN